MYKWHILTPSRLYLITVWILSVNKCSQSDEEHCQSWGRSLPWQARTSIFHSRLGSTHNQQEILYIVTNLMYTPRTLTADTMIATTTTTTTATTSTTILLLLQLQLKIQDIPLIQADSCNSFCLKIHCHGNEVWSGSCHGNEGRSSININDTVKLTDPDNPTTEPNREWIGWLIAEIWPFEVLPGREVGR